jgi:hypothetical protein
LSNDHLRKSCFDNVIDSWVENWAGTDIVEFLAKKGAGTDVVV